MDRHWTDRELIALFDFDPQTEDGRKLYHLSLCFDCQERLRQLGPRRAPRVFLKLFGRPRPLPPEAREPAVQGRLARSLAPWQDRLDRALAERREAAQVVLPLLEQPPAHRRLLVVNAERFHTLGVAGRLLMAASEVWCGDPAEAQERVELAFSVLRLIPEERYPASTLADFRARGWAYLANCRRILSDLPGAEGAFSRAQVLLKEGTGDPLETARHLDLLSSLRRDQRRFREASACLEIAITLYEGIGDRGNGVRLSIQRGMLLWSAGCKRAALSLLDRLARRVRTEATEPSLAFTACHNFAVALADGGRVAEARGLLPWLHRAARELDQEHGAARVRWLEAMIAHRLGRLLDAERKYQQVRAFFARHGIGYDAALVTLDLAVLYLEQGRPEPVRRLTQEMIPLFLAQDLPWGAMAALGALLRAVRDESVSTALLRTIAGWLSELRQRPPAPGLAH